MIAGPSAMLTGTRSPLGSVIAEILLSVSAISVVGGTDQIQHTIIAERILSLPREPDTGSDLPLPEAAGAEWAVAGRLSLDGCLSLAFCLEMLDRVAALVLCDTGPGFRSDDARQRWNSRALAAADRLKRDGLGCSVTMPGPTPGSALGVRPRPGRGMLVQSSSQVIEQKVVILDAGHMWNIDQPEITRDRVGSSGRRRTHRHA
jgi:hypothetical protein